MKILKRILAIILIVIVLAAAGAMIFFNSVKTRALPDYNAAVDLENLTSPVTVFRDSMGIPHIYADNEEDLYRTVGYVMAQDRMWQMDLLRRITTGRLSEVPKEIPHGVSTIRSSHPSLHGGLYGWDQPVYQQESKKALLRVYHAGIQTRSLGN